MTTGDCFIMIGSKEEEPMTLYLLKQIRGNKVDAFSISIDKHWIHGWDYPDEYDNDIPEEAIVLPCDTYTEVKRQMVEFCTEAHKYTQNNIVKADFKFEVGKHYYERFIETITKIEDNRVYFKTLRIDPEDISPNWTWNAAIDVLADHMVPLSEEVYNEILSRYYKFVSHLQEFLFDLAQQNAGAAETAK